MSAERDLEKIINCTDDEKREILHSFSKERLVENKLDSQSARSLA